MFEIEEMKRLFDNFSVKADRFVKEQKKTTKK
jgi:hypothetical protein